MFYSFSCSFTTQYILFNKIYSPNNVYLCKCMDRIYNMEHKLLNRIKVVLAEKNKSNVAFGTIG